MYLIFWVFVSFTIIVNTTSTTNNTSYTWQHVIEGIVDNLGNIISDIASDIGKITPNLTVCRENISVHLYTNCSVQAPVINTTLNDITLLNLFFDPEKESVFIVHGWLADDTSEINVRIKEAILNNYDVQVFVIGWPAQIANYFDVFGSITMVGNYLGEYINSLHQSFNYSLSNVKLIGHSLGAHVCGITGKNTNGSIQSIMGLDPAGPGFSEDITYNRLIKSDAQVVQVMHTSMKFLGMNFTFGDSDFFPNGGYLQPICNTTEDLIGTCSHSMSYKYYAKSIADELFVGVPCQSYEIFKNNSCRPGKRITMGGFNLDERAHGEYYLDID